MELVTVKEGKKWSILCRVQTPVKPAVAFPFVQIPSESYDYIFHSYGLNNSADWVL